MSSGGERPGGGAGVVAVPDPGRGADQVVHVEPDRRAEAYGVAGHGHRAARVLAEAPQGGAQGGQRTLLRRVGPEQPGELAAGGAGAQPDQRDHPLQPARHHDRHRLAEESEASEQVQ